MQEYGIPRATSEELLSERFTGLIEGEVSAREFAQRIDATVQVHRGINDTLEQVQEFYASVTMVLELNILKLSSIGALDPAVGEEIVAGRITTAQIGGEAARAGFSITRCSGREITEELV